ncbi:5'-nucleotidase C-terminal domain-containing protein [Macrococcus brunensis]|uniref:5'-nucleotidase C-terminal domain-containing protein n=1 Tax=Macrococcus brunensis TaxID=198483 RepID=UPI001EF03349|nr:5'-nucleotidase C-terminal domain-containing protein [Macrococcus brunensis]ULG71550.1 5'-nucleotidase C-terminal domain-containing protein [Macrococcus brunensis]
MTYQLTILSTTDMHAHLSLYDYFLGTEQETNGLILAGSKIKALVEENQQKETQTVVLDNGDILQGNLIADYAADKRPERHPVMQMMNAVGYDAMTLGNHEFNYGLDYLKSTLAQAEFPVVNCNIRTVEGDYLFNPYTVIEKTFSDGETIRVGVTGVVPEQILMWDDKWLHGKVVVQDMYQTAKACAAELKKHCDVVVCLCHTGFDASLPDEDGLENQVHRISTIDDIDAIIFGHTHQLFPSDTLTADYIDGSRIHHVYAVQPASFGSHLGRIELTLKKTENGFEVESGHSEVIELKNNTVIDPALVELNETTHQAIFDYINEEIGQTEHYIDSFFSQLAPSRAVEIVARSGRRAYEKLRGDIPNLISTSAPLKAGRDGASDYVMISPGSLTIKDAISIYRFPNKLAAVKVTGKVLKEWLEWSASAFNCYSDELIVKDNQSIAPGFPSYNMDIFYELDYQIDLSVPARYNHAAVQVTDSVRIQGLTFEGRAVEPDDEFTVLTNDYRLNFTPFLKSLEGEVLDVDVRETVIEYIKEEGCDFKAAWPFRFTEDGTYRMKTSRHAEDVLLEYPARKVADAADDFIIVELNMKERNE